MKADSGERKIYAETGDVRKCFGVISIVNKSPDQQSAGDNQQN